MRHRTAPPVYPFLMLGPFCLLIGHYTDTGVALTAAIGVSLLLLILDWVIVEMKS